MKPDPPLDPKNRPPPFSGGEPFGDHHQQIDETGDQLWVSSANGALVGGF